MRGRNLVGGKKIGRKLVGRHRIADDDIGGHALQTADGIEVDISDVKGNIGRIDTSIDFDIVYHDIASCTTHYTGIGQIAGTNQWGIHRADHECRVGINGRTRDGRKVNSGHCGSRGIYGGDVRSRGSKQCSKESTGSHRGRRYGGNVNVIRGNELAIGRSYECMITRDGHIIISKKIGFIGRSIIIGSND